MPTTYPYAHAFAVNTDTGSAAANAAYNDLAALTIGLLMTFDGVTALATFGKGNSGAAVHGSQINDGRIDFNVARATTSSLWRGNAIAADGTTWSWVFFTLLRSSGAHTRYGGPKGGTIADLSPTDITSGSGAVNSDASFPFTLGANGTNFATRTMRVAMSGIWSSVLTLAQCQAIAADLSTGVQPVSAWIPGSGSASSIANYITAGSPPAMSISGATLVAGPDAAGGSVAGAVRVRRMLL